MNPSRPFILRPVATSLLMAAILLSGLVAYRELPVSALPQVDYPTIQVLTFYPGASPEVMASSVTAPLERQFGQVPGLNQMTSTSSFGASVVTLQFVLDLDIDVAEQEVQAAINAAGTFLPRDLPNPPIYSKVNPADAPILTLALTSETLPLPKIQDLADTRLAQKISQLPGVGYVAIGGGQKPAVRIRANPHALAAYGLSLEDVRTALGAANVNRAKGSFDGERQAYVIGANDQLASSEEYRPLVVAWRNGAPVRLSDVAEVVDGTENEEQAAWANRTPAVLVNVQRQPGANIIAVVDRIKALLPQLTATLPSSVRTEVLTDRTTTIRASVHSVQMELALTVALVVLVIFAFLRSLSATVIPSCAVPLSLVGTLGVMYLLGYSLDNLSLMALTISTGFVVDDAIVMVENVARHVEDGEPPLEAALRGAGEIGFTIVSLTVSLIAVLIPLLFMQDVVGRLFREFAVTLAVTILLSAVVSLTLTPMMAARLLRNPREVRHGRVYEGSERFFDAVLDAYARSLRWVLARQPATLAVAVGTLVVTLALYVVVPKGFFPVQDTGLVLGVSEAPPSTSFAGMVERQKALVDVLLRDPAVASVSSFLGVDGANPTPNTGRVQLDLEPVAERDASAVEVIRRLEPELARVPGIRLFLQPVQDLTVEDRVSRTQYQWSLESADAAELDEWVPRLVDRLRARRELRNVASDRQAGGLEVSIEIDRDRAARLGITPQRIDDALYDAFGQRQISTIYTQRNQYRVILEVAPEFARDPSALDHVHVRPPGGEPVPLSVFTRVETGTAPLAIFRQGQFPASTISFDLAPGASLGDAVTAIEEVESEADMPASLRATFQGTAAAFRASLANEPILVLAALVTVYIVLGVLYESYVHPVTILSTLPSAGLGALLALLLCGLDLDVIALIGIILLIGIVMKNAILMIDFALEAERRDGRPAEEAIYQACLLRFRPILMTTLAALLGAMPLALGTGTGSELRHPLGVAIVGGLLVSQLLTLYTTPVVYLAFDRLARRVAGRRAGTAVSPAARPGEA